MQNGGGSSLAGNDSARAAPGFRKIDTPCNRRQQQRAAQPLAKFFTSITFARLWACRGALFMDQQRGTPPGNSAAQASKYVGTGLTWALSTMLFLYLGSLADARLDTTPWLTLAGAFIGATAGFWYMYYHLVVEPQRRQDREKKQDG
jgi:hypothetical protein